MASSQIVNTVIDSLDVRVFRHAAASLWLARQAEIWRMVIARFEPGDPDTFVKVPGLGTFRLKMGGAAPYEFVLINPQIADIRIWNPGRWSSRAAAQTGQFYVRFRSVFLQQHGLPGVHLVLEALTTLGCQPGCVHIDSGPEFDRIARVDLAVDTQEEREMVWADLDTFVCRARKLDTWAHLTPANVEEVLKMDLSAGSYLPMDRPGFDEFLPAFMRSASRVMHSYVRTVVNELETHQEADLSRVVSHNRKPQTVYFGRFGSQLYARRYNKLGSLVTQNKLFMLDVWLQNGWDGESPVLRTEFSVSGDFLKNYTLRANGAAIQDCRDLSLLEHVAPVLWDYLTTDWLSKRIPSETDSNNRRWALDESWAVLVGAFGETDLVGHRDHSRTVPHQDSHLLAQSRGCSVSAVALRVAKHGSYEAAIESISEDFYGSLNDDFMTDVIDRLDEYGLDAYTDSQMSALFRAEAMKEGTGS